jgi:hypothetical protein
VRGGVKSYNRTKAWPSRNHTILSGVPAPRECSFPEVGCLKNSSLSVDKKNYDHITFAEGMELAKNWFIFVEVQCLPAF